MKKDDRTRLILSGEELKLLKNTTLAIFGIGGVGGVVLETLVRLGIGHIHIVDKDIVEESNFNRQIIATSDYIGRKKIDTAYDRSKKIREDVCITKKDTFVLKNNIKESLTVDNRVIKIDYIIDCIDTVTAKISLIEYAKKNNIKIISCMGTGYKLEPSMLEVSDIYRTSICPLCRVMRRELKKRNIKDLKVVYSREEPIKNKTKCVGSLPFVPNYAGILIAREVVREIINR